jgi:hypothetical protein
MSDDRRRPGQQASRRDETLRHWIAAEVHPYSEPLREALDRSGLGRRGVRGADDLRRLHPIELGALGDGRRWVLQPTPERIRTAAPPAVRARLVAADVLGRQDAFARRDVDLPFKPVTWTAAALPDGVLLTGWTTSDLELLGQLGRRALAIAGVHPDDRIACTAGAAGVGPVQLELGARQAGVAHLRADPAGAAELAVAAPSVVSGTPATIEVLLDRGLPSSVRMLVVHVGGTADAAGLPALRRRAGVPVRLWWAPPGVRAAWATCDADQLHTWPEHEVIEVVDDARAPAGSGRLVWSAVGWRGSVWLRLVLGPAGRIEHGECRCGRTTPRVLGARRPAAAGAAR